MSEMIERVARAICEADGDGNCDTYRKLARAAIEAMREPVGAMRIAAIVCQKGPWVTSADIWRAMIDAALEAK